MGKLSPEEEARQKMLMRERDRERKRMKRMNPEYRRMEQERDRDRKKARRANEAFRQLEKLRDKIRKDRKKGIIVDDALLAGEYVTLSQVPVEPEVIISDPLPPSRNQANRRANQALNNGGAAAPNGQLAVGGPATSDVSSVAALNTPSTSGSAVAPTASAAAAHMTQLNAKGGLLGYPPPNFHHPLPIAGVALMPQLCHPILHQNLGAALYSANGIKQEYPLIKQEYAGNEAQGGAGVDPSTATGNGGAPSGGGNNRDANVLNVHVNFHEQSGGGPHGLHQQQCNMFHNMAPQSHMSHMRSHASLPPPPPPPATHQQQQQQQHQQQQQQLQQHYAAAKTS